METQILKEVLACLPKDRTVFRYGKDDYALLLLSYFAANGKRISDIKRSHYKRLLEKPSVKRLVSTFGNGKVTGSDFHYGYAIKSSDFVLTVGSWNTGCDRYAQTSANSGNLVLQLNFNSNHDRNFGQLIGNDELDYFVCDGHPVLQPGERPYYRNTLGWARMDLDFDTGEVLIEEVQNDWLRNANYYLNRASRRVLRWPESDARKEEYSMVKQYVNNLDSLKSIWAEAILTAVFRFCVEELGMKTIYYHTFDTGNRLKQISWSHPPRSLYTELPKKFCFSLTDAIPVFLLKSKIVKRKLKKIRNPLWYEIKM